jgi:4-amino-4-deoxy-L-arabinose transferase-like glycosyltransferase
MNMNRTRTWVVLSILILFLFLVPGINHGLWRPDEPRVAGTCAEMARTRDFVVPYLNGQPFLEKPPLYYAAGAIAGSILGEDRDVPYRLASLLFGILTVFLTFLTVARKDGVMMGLIAGGIAAGSWEIFMLSRWIQVDIALVFGVTLAFFAYQRWLDTPRIIDSILLGLGTGIAFMGKGLVGPAIIAAGILTDIIRQRDLRIAWRIRPFTVIAFMLVAILPWVVGLLNSGGWPFFREAIVVNNLMRFTGAPEGAALGHQNGIFYYFNRFPSGIIPWTLIFIPAFIASIRNFRNDRYVSWVIGPFILLSIASTKRGIYLAPLYPAVACMIADWLGKATRLKWEDVLVKITWAIIAAGCLAPFAGIFLGVPVLGTVMGLIALGSLIFITRGGVKQREAVSLVMAGCIAMFASTSVYYQYLKPERDFLDFTRKAVAAAGSNDIILLAPEEILRGVVSMTTGKIHKVAASPSEIKDKGWYIWTERGDKMLKILNRQFKVRLIYEKTMNKRHHEMARIAFIEPDAGRKL